MLNQVDIDELQMQIQSGIEPEIYYVAHVIETREGVIDEEHYKSVSRFRIIKIKISEITNAYYEYLNYVKHLDQYHIEEEEVYYELDKKYIHYYTTPNGKSSYDKDMNPRMPSAIYGYTRKLLDESGNVVKTYIDPSPVKEVYTNELQYGILKGTDVTTAYNNKKLDWKYMTLKNKQVVDGIEYKYVTSNWFVLKCKNFPKTEHILINVNDKTAYFRDLTDAFKFKEQLEA